MGLKILHSADWHLGSPFAGFSPEQRDYLKREQRKLPEKIADICLRENCDLVLLGGDLFDAPTGADQAESVRLALARCRVPVFVSPGNHDYLIPGSPWLTEAWPENVHIFREELSCVSLPELSCRVYGAGYRSMDCPGLLEGFRAEGEEHWKIGLFHGDPMRLRSPYCPVTTAQARDSGLNYLALGHIHKAGSFRARNCLCAWPGCPMGRGFDETREKGVYITELGDRVDIRFVPLDTPRFYELELDADVQTFGDILPPVENMDFYRITLRGTKDTPLEELRRRCGAFANLQLIDCREQRGDVWEHAGEDTLEGMYFRLLRDKQEQVEPDMAKCLELAAEISRKILEGKEVAL